MGLQHERQAATWLWDLVRGLQDLHLAGILHCDVKLGNMLLGEDLRAKLGDFGVACRVGALVGKGGTDK